MVVENVLHMNVGNGESSYANNSIDQKIVILKARSVLEDTVKDMYKDSFPDCLKIADLGCSSGPNTFLVISEIIDTVHGLCEQNGDHRAPEFQVGLNDLPDNDFNTIFKSLPAFHATHKNCFISGVPGSFYGRLFPSNSLHLVHSSDSLHWLSQVPEMLEKNKGNIYLAKTSPLNVLEAYMKQFQRDFTTFLQLRAEEIIPCGRMILTIIGRSIADPTSKDCCLRWELLAKSLLDMVAEGLVEESDLDSFNLPFYSPYKDEVKDLIQKEGSFTLDRLVVLEDNWDDLDIHGDNDNDNGVFDTYNTGKMVAKSVRAVTEPMLTSHFGNSIIEKLFEKYAKHVAEQLAIEKPKGFYIVVSLTKKNKSL